MKLGEALIKRSDLQKRLEQMSLRLNNNAKYQEGSQTSEDPNELLEELRRITSELMFLIRDINQTNAITKIDEKMSLAEAIARRDMLMKENEILRSFFNAAGNVTHIYSASEIKTKSSVDVKKLRQKLTKLLRKLEYWTPKFRK